MYYYNRAYARPSLHGVYYAIVCYTRAYAQRFSYRLRLLYTAYACVRTTRRVLLYDV